VLAPKGFKTSNRHKEDSPEFDNVAWARHQMEVVTPLKDTLSTKSQILTRMTQMWEF